MTEELPMQTVLYELDQLVNRGKLSTEEITKTIHDMGLLGRDDGRVNIEIINQIGKTAIEPDIVHRFNGVIDATWRHRASVWIVPDKLTSLARVLPHGFYMEQANVPVADDEGPGVTGSDEYRNAGANGIGVRIGVIDVGYEQLTNAINAGNAPTTSTRTNYVTGTTFESGGTHGTRCVETVFDHAPGATYFLYKIENVTHFGNAVDHAVANNVDILSHSLAHYNTGWNDNSGDACAAAQTAANNGILFFTSAGNEARRHWQGLYNSTDGDNWHDWTPNDESVNISMANGATASFRLSWNTAGGTYDYDLYLFDATLTNILAWSLNYGNDYESITYTNNTGVAQTVHLAVWRYSGGATTMEVFGSGGTWLQHIISLGSTASPSNTTHPNVISIGAVDHNDFASPSDTSGIIMDYSSQGPTNSGNQAPDISGPTNTTVTGGLSFGGTSCAAPNVAGAAAAFWSSASSLSASGVRHLLFEKAKIFKDWGENGSDMIYGHGGVQLYSYYANTVWVDKDAGNISGSPALPYYTVAQAQNAVTSQGRVVFLSDTYQETIILNKGSILYDNIGDPAIIEYLFDQELKQSK
jgi:hypothetical protein